jgi:hypothetical protein
MYSSGTASRASSQSFPSSRFPPACACFGIVAFSRSDQLREAIGQIPIPALLVQFEHYPVCPHTKYGVSTHQPVRHLKRTVGLNAMVRKLLCMPRLGDAEYC